MSKQRNIDSSQSGLGITTYNLKNKIVDSQSQPFVSIVMAVRDTQPYLAECLDSIVCQSYTHWELIAVNDHSRDGSMAILSQYANQDARIRVYQNQGDKLIPALQTAYQHCKGKLINRMDSDDLMPHDKLQVMVEHWLQYGPGHIIAGATEHFVSEGKLGEGFSRYDSWLQQIAREKRHYEEIYQECVIPSHCWLLHRMDFEAVGGFDPDVYPEDYDLCFRFYRHGLTVVGIDKILHYWRDRSDRISRTWDCYKDNRYLELKFKYFFELDRDKSRPLLLWGAGRNGKDMAKILLRYEKDFIWVCDNEKKIGANIYGIILGHCDSVAKINDAQILVAVSSPVQKENIRQQLLSWQKKPGRDFWFFT